jgi:hypothetical protein
LADRQDPADPVRLKAFLRRRKGKIKALPSRHDTGLYKNFFIVGKHFIPDYKTFIFNSKQKSKPFPEQVYQ